MAKDWEKLVKRVKALEKEIARMVLGKKPAVKKTKRKKAKKKKAEKVTAAVTKVSSRKNAPNVTKQKLAGNKPGKEKQASAMVPKLAEGLPPMLTP
jgi:hypothetical protein